jgi:hypothetical protein
VQKKGTIRWTLKGCVQRQLRCQKYTQKVDNGPEPWRWALIIFFSLSPSYTLHNLVYGQYLHWKIGELWNNTGEAPRFAHTVSLFWKKFHHNAHRLWVTTNNRCPWIHNGHRHRHIEIWFFCQSQTITGHFADKRRMQRCANCIGTTSHQLPILLVPPYVLHL